MTTEELTRVRNSGRFRPELIHVYTYAQDRSWDQMVGCQIDKPYLRIVADECTDRPL